MDTLQPVQQLHQPDEAWLHRILQASQQSAALPRPLVLGLSLCLGALALAGIAGNLMVIVFFHRSLRDLPQNVYVIALAALDLIVCAVVVPSTVYQDVWREASSDFACKALHVLRCSLIIASAFLLCLIAVDRFVIICFVPGIQTGRRKSALLICLAVGAGLCIGLPLGLSTGTRHQVKINVGKLGAAYHKPLNMQHCTSDYSIVSKATVKAYKTGLTVLFLLLLLLIVFFYSSIFLFVRRRQIRWAKSRNFVRRVRSSPRGAAAAGMSTESAVAATAAVSVSAVSRRSFSIVSRLDDGVTEVTSTCCARGAGGGGGCSGVQETNIDAVMNSSDDTEDIEGDDGAEEQPVPGQLEDEEQQQGQAMLSRRQEQQQHRTRHGAQPHAREDSVVSGRLAIAQRHLSERTRKKPHIKTAKVLSIITFFYLLSYLPFFLVFHLHEASGASDRTPGHIVLSSGTGGSDPRSSAESADRNSSSRSNASLHSAAVDGFGQIVKLDDLGEGAFNPRGSEGTLSSEWLRSVLTQTLFYFYFINHGVNPIIYGCMNTYFKQQVCGFCNSVRTSCHRPPLAHG